VRGEKERRGQFVPFFFSLLLPLLLERRLRMKHEDESEGKSGFSEEDEKAERDKDSFLPFSFFLPSPSPRWDSTLREQVDGLELA